MSGLLSNKERILDTIITQQGREQISTGKFRAAFFSFTDANVFYDKSTLNDDIVSGTNDVGRRIALEACSLPQDQVTFESSDDGRLISFGNSQVQTSNGRILTFLTGGTQNSPHYMPFNISGSDFHSQSNVLLNSSIDSFSKLRIIGSPDIFDENIINFEISTNTVNFTLTNNAPLNTSQIQSIDVNHVESLFQDKNLSHIPNFQFLPPVNKPSPGSDQVAPLGYYMKLNQAPYADFNTIQAELNSWDQSGFKQRINFTETSKDNNVICQFFEISSKEVMKLDVVDFGMFFDATDNQVTQDQIIQAKKEGKELELESQTKHVFFVGKTFTNDSGSDVFVNLFTLIFS